ncbi:MAG: outer membrane beta-barrel protein [Cyclobacteriaceae bacterium]|nr:outer membrane beta-barrel protein [Cyclobacteriaceae bacterium]
MKPNQTKSHLWKITLAVSLLLLLMTPTLIAQTMNSVKQENQPEQLHAKNLHWGVAVQLLWTTLDGPALPESYYTKPSLGIGLRAEYYFLPFLGMSAGVGFQQRGAGIINPDHTGGAYSHPLTLDIHGNQGDPDSTHLQKLRFNTLELPVSLLLQTPNEIIEGIRLSASVGVIYIYHFEANLVFESVSDGDHYVQPVTPAYLRHDLGYQLSAGVDINIAETGSRFQVHYLYNAGLGNVYAADQGQGRQVAYGIRLTCLF